MNLTKTKTLLPAFFLALFVAMGVEARTAKRGIVLFSNVQGDEALEIGRHFDLIIRGYTSAEDAARFHTQNPDIILMGYQHFPGIYGNVPEWERVNLNPDWFVLDHNGNRIQADNWGWYLMNINNTGWQNFLVEKIATMVSEFPQYEGLITDDTIISIKSSRWHSLIRNEPSVVNDDYTVTLKYPLFKPTQRVPHDDIEVFNNQLGEGTNYFEGGQFTPGETKITLGIPLSGLPLSPGTPVYVNYRAEGHADLNPQSQYVENWRENALALLERINGVTGSKILMPNSGERWDLMPVTDGGHERSFWPGQHHFRVAKFSRKHAKCRAPR